MNITRLFCTDCGYPLAHCKCACTLLKKFPYAESSSAASAQAPAPLSGWAIDNSTGRPILVKNQCSVIEGADATFALEAIRKELCQLHEPRPVQVPVKVLEDIRTIARLCVPLDMPTKLELAINNLCMAVRPLLERIRELEGECEAMMETLDGAAPNVAHVSNLVAERDAALAELRELKATLRRCGDCGRVSDREEFCPLCLPTPERVFWQPKDAPMTMQDEAEEAARRG